MFHINKITKKIVSILTVSALTLSLIVPNLSLGREFNSDSELTVYPMNELLDFGSVNIGHEITKNFVIENSGYTQKNVRMITFPGNEFGYVGPTFVTIPAQEEVTLPIVFAPKTVGTKSSTFTIASETTGETKLLTVTGTSTSNSNNGVEVSTRKIHFPLTPLNHVSNAEIDVTNRTNQNVSVSGTIKGDLDFVLKTYETSFIEPGKTKRLIVEFNPTNDKPKSGILTLHTSAPGYEIFKIDLLGPGVNEIIEEERLNAFAELSIQSNLVSMGYVSVHEQLLKTIFVKNTGNKDLNIELVDKPKGPFTVDTGSMNSTRVTVKPGHEGKIRISFKPDYQGNYTSTFRIKTNAVNVPELTFSISGQGINNGGPKFDFELNTLISDKKITKGERAVLSYSTNVPAKVSVTIIHDGERVETVQSKGSEYNLPNKQYTVEWTPRSFDRGMYYFTVNAVSNDGQADTASKSFEVLPQDSYRRIHTNPSDSYFNVPNSTINTDRGEKAYFNVFVPVRSNIVYTITSRKTGQTVIQRSFATVNSGTHNYEFYWDGKGYSGNKVSEGDYLFEFKIEPRDTFGEIRIYKGSISVDRNTNHTGVRTVTTSVGSYSPNYTNTRVISSYYTENRYTELRNNENLISELIATPSYLNEFNKKTIISFNTLHDGVATASVKDIYGNLVRKLTLNRTLVDGYHHEELEWYGDASDGKAAIDGTYKIEVHTAQGNETDTDVTYVTLNRGHRGTVTLPYQNPYNPVTPVNTVRPYAPSYAGSCEGFNDIYGTEDFCKAVSFVVDQGIFEGSVVNGRKVLRADDYLTRAEATAVLIRTMRLQVLPYNENLDGNLGFSDLDTAAWYMPHIKTIIKSAVQQQTRYGTWVRNIMQGYPDGTVRPNQVMSRAEFYKVFLESAVNSAAVNANFALNYNVVKAPFSDTAVNELTEWYLPYAEWAAKYLDKTEYAKQYFDSYELNSGVRRFKGKKGITRGEVIDLLYTTQALGLIHY